MNAKSIEWADGFPAKVPASVAYDALEVIRLENGGELTAVNVVRHARDRNHVPHPQVFDRGSKAAAEEYYKDRARLLIRCVMVRYEGGPDEPTRIYHIVREGVSEVARTRTAKIYGDIEEALADPEQRRYVLEHALWDVERWRKKYAVLSELAEIFTAIDKAAAG